MLLRSLGVRALSPSLRFYSTKVPFKTKSQQRLAQLDRLFSTGVTRFHEITGYSEIERIKADLSNLEKKVENMRTKVREARELYSYRVSQRSASQREMNELLMRKPAWTAPDLERFTQSYKADHEIQLGVEQAKRDYDDVESQLEDLQLQTGKLIGARYREEQMFSDRIRQASTWGTWVLMGINIVSFVIVQLILEPWKRRRSVRSFELKVQQMFEEEKFSTKENLEKTTKELESIQSTQHEQIVSAEVEPNWSNLWGRLQQPEMTVRPVEIGVLALACSIISGIMPVLMLAISSR